MVAWLLKNALLWALIFYGVTLSAVCHAENGKKILFSGYEWVVKSGRHGPGNNDWSPDNVWVDKDGFLHLKITFRHEAWSCAELMSVDNFAYGRYQFLLVGAIDRLDPNIVLGLFVYPAEGNTDPDSEIDIEFTRWGEVVRPIGNYTVTAAGQTQPFDFSLDGSYSAHQFNWTEREVTFESFFGHIIKDEARFRQWSYQSAGFEDEKVQPPVRVHMNLWLFRGEAPLNGQEQEVIIKKFMFFPERQ